MSGGRVILHFAFSRGDPPFCIFPWRDDAHSFIKASPRLRCSSTEGANLKLALLEREGGTRRVTGGFCELRIAHYLMMSAIIPLASVASGMGKIG